MNTLEITRVNLPVFFNISLKFVFSVLFHHIIQCLFQADIFYTSINWFYFAHRQRDRALLQSPRPDLDSASDSFPEEILPHLSWIRPSGFHFFGFPNNILLQSKVVSITSDPQPGGPGLCIYVPQ
jgi:hypothetical protein